MGLSFKQKKTQAAGQGAGVGGLTSDVSRQDCMPPGKGGQVRGAFQAGAVEAVLTRPAHIPA